MKGVIFENKKLRESFMQEILTAADNAQFKIEIEKYINNPNNNMLIYKNVEEIGFHKERVIEYVRCDMSDKILENDHQKVRDVKYQDNTLFSRLFIITNKGIQILKDIPKAKECPDCDDQEFCPRGPY